MNVLLLPFLFSPFLIVPIKKGTAIWTSKDEELYDERICTDEEFEAFQKWCIENGKEWGAVANEDEVDTVAISDREKHPGNYGNHSCDPNTDKNRVVLRNIATGEELTGDYSQFSTKDWEMKCNCGAKKYKGVIRGNL